MIRLLAPAVLMLTIASANAAADPGQTYAYISDVSVTGSGGNDFIKYHCAFTVQVPRVRLDHAPTGASPELLIGATTARDYRVYTPSDEVDCTDFAHTWRLVTLDPKDAKHVDITLPAAQHDWLQRILMLAIGLIVLSYAIEKLTGKSVSLIHYLLKFSMWRSDRKLARGRKTIAEIQAKRIPRAQVVETKHDLPPSE